MQNRKLNKIWNIKCGKGGITRIIPLYKFNSSNEII